MTLDDYDICSCGHRLYQHGGGVFVKGVSDRVRGRLTGPCLGHAHCPCRCFIPLVEVSETFRGEYDVCNHCEQVFRRPTASPCVHCNHVHRDDEWCFAGVRGANFDGQPLSVHGFVASAHESIFNLAMSEGLGGRWAWALNEKMSIVIGIRADPAQGYIRFWVRDTERCNVVVDRESLVSRLSRFVPLVVAIEMIDPPALH
jgi:hypothetical protein